MCVRFKLLPVVLLTLIAVLQESSAWARTTLLPDSEWSQTLNGETFTQPLGVRPYSKFTRNEGGSIWQRTYYDGNLRVVMEKLIAGKEPVETSGIFNFHLDDPMRYSLVYQVRMDRSYVEGPYDFEMTLDGQTFAFADATQFSSGGWPGYPHFALSSVGELEAGDHTLTWRSVNTGRHNAFGKMFFRIAIPEPGTWSLTLVGVVGMALWRWRRRQ